MGGSPPLDGTNNGTTAGLITGPRNLTGPMNHARLHSKTLKSPYNMYMATFSSNSSVVVKAVDLKPYIATSRPGSNPVNCEKILLKVFAK